MSNSPHQLLIHVWQGSLVSTLLNWDCPGAMEMCKKAKKAVTVNYKLALASPRIKACAAAAADLQHSLKEFTLEIKNEAFCTLGKLALLQ